MSLILFTSCGEYFSNGALERFGGFKNWGQVIRTVTYVRDLVLLAKEETVLQGMNGHILHRNCLLKRVFEGQKGRKAKTT